MPKPYEIENYLTGRGLVFRRRGVKAELKTCPFCSGGEHNDRWTCVVYLDEDGGNYKCMRGSCDATGTFYGFVQHHGDDPTEFSKKRYSQKQWEPRTPVTFKTAPTTELPLTPTALDYLQRRGFIEDTLSKAAVWCNDKGNICFGYYHEGQLCLVKERLPRKPLEGEPKAFQSWAGGLRTLWGLEQCESDGALIITFGEYDRLAVLQAGMTNVVSVPCGDSDLEWMNICYPALERYETITLWIDNDKSGQDALPKIADRLGRHRVRVVRATFKDANEMLAHRTRDAGQDQAYLDMWNAVADAEWYWQGSLVEVADITDVEACFDGYLSGIEYLDKALGGFYFNRLSVHTGDTKHGKSTSVVQMVLHALSQNAVACVWTGEDSPQDFKYKVQVHLAGHEGTERKTSRRSGRDYSYVRPEWRAKIDEYLRGRLILLDQRAVDEEGLVENFTLAHKRYGCDVFVVDNLMKTVAAKATTDVHFRQTQVVNKLSNFVKEFRVHGHLVTHTNKTGNPLEPPRRETVSGAKEIVNLADNVISWWRVPMEVKPSFGMADTVCSILANRVYGDEGSVNLKFDPFIQRFSSNSIEAARVYLT